MAKLNFTKISPEVAARILSFLNCAKTPADIAGLEPQTGPVVDDPSTGPGDQERDYDIGQTVAKRILERRAELPDDRFTHLHQIDAIKGLGQDKLDDLAYSFGPAFYGECRHVYLRIESIEDYSPVEPQTEKVMAPIQYRRDCIRNKGHEDGTIPDKEVQARSLTGLVYREYLDADYLIPKTDKLINADVNEPLFDRRVPGTVIYAHPGETLCIHVLNGDKTPHTFHIHGVDYGPDSDGAYPMGTQAKDGRRSDEICPGQSWTYTFNVREEHIGCWPFHDHYTDASQTILRGMFGGLVVLPKSIKPPTSPDTRFKVGKDGRLDLAKYKLDPRVRDRRHRAYRHLVEDMHEVAIGDLVRPPWKEKVHHVPVFFHIMDSKEGNPPFESPELEEHTGVFEHTFDAEGSAGYFCSMHPDMTGTVNVVPGGPANVTVNIVDDPDMMFSPQTVDIGVGGTVRWENHSDAHHTVTGDGAVMPSHCVNGRAFVGNAPTVEVDTGDTIRWYIFNLDLGHEFHNFHTHNIRWKFAGENADVRVLSPAESFCIESKAPPVVLTNPKIEAMQDKKKRPKNAKQYTFVGEYLFHCHVHHHFMHGMAGLVRARHKLWLTPELACELQEERGLRLYTGDNKCPDVDRKRCAKRGEGTWQEVAGDPRVAMMHACLLPKTSKVLYFGYESRYSPDEDDYAWLWDEANGYQMTANQPKDITPGGYRKWSLWSGEHTHLDDADGTLLIHGGYRDDLKKAYLFDPAAETWQATGATQYGRFYATTLTMPDGKALTLFGSNLGGSTSRNLEVYDPSAASWEAPIDFPPAFDVHEFYPWTFVLPDGDLFIAGPHAPTHRFQPSDPTSYQEFDTVHGDRSTSGEKGTAVLLTLRPPNYEVRAMIMGGNFPDAKKTSEVIDLSKLAPAWSSPPELELNLERQYQCHSTLLPDGRVFLCGGIQSGPDGGACEIYDPEHPEDGWTLGPAMKHARTYHSSAVLLTDGSVLVGGDPQESGSTKPTPHERYLPDYYDMARPQVTDAPEKAGWGQSIEISSPQAGLAASVVLMRPGAATHGWNMTQRRVELEITAQDASKVTVTTPPDANVAPPGWYLLFVLDGERVPSEGRWIRITSA